MGLEGRSFRHHGTDDKTFDVLRLHPGDRIEAHLARLPDEVAVARLAHAELRDPRPDQRDASHARLPQTLKSFQSCPRACIVLLRAVYAKAWLRSQSRSRPITTRRISEVPPPGRRKRASRK